MVSVVEPLTTTRGQMNSDKSDAGLAPELAPAPDADAVEPGRGVAVEVEVFRVAHEHNPTANAAMKIVVANCFINAVTTDRAANGGHVYQQLYGQV